MLEHVGIRQQPLHEIDGEGFGERLRVDDRHRHVDVAEVAAREALLDPQVLAVAVASGVEPAEVVEAQRVDHEGVAIPLTHRVAVPRGPHIVRIRQLTAVSVNLPEDGFHLIQEEGFAGKLDDLERFRQQNAVWHAVRQTI